MKKILLALCLLTPFAHAQEEYMEEPTITSSPSKSFQIISQRQSGGEGENSYEGYSAILQFKDKSIPKIVLSKPSDGVMYPGDYSISPNEKWIINEQKCSSTQTQLLCYQITDAKKLVQIPIEKYVDQATSKLFKPTNAEVGHHVIYFRKWLPDGNSFVCVSRVDFMGKTPVRKAIITINLATKTATAVRAPKEQ